MSLNLPYNEFIQKAKNDLEKKGYGFYNFGKKTLIYKGYYQINVTPNGNEIKMKGTMNSVEFKYKLLGIPLWHKYIKKNEFNKFQEILISELNKLKSNG